MACPFCFTLPSLSNDDLISHRSPIPHSIGNRDIFNTE
jgi:hypothetical protein